MEMEWRRDLEGLLQKPQELEELARNVLATTTQDFEFIVERAEGPFVWDARGRRYFDFSSAVGAMNLGHNVPEVNAEIKRQLEVLVQMPHNDWPNAVTVLLAKRLCNLTTGSFKKKIFFGNSGTEAVEAAIKILLAARPNRQTFIAFDGAFHGRTGYSLALNASKPIHREHFPQAFEVVHLPFPEAGMDSSLWLNEVDRAMADINLDYVNAAFIELVQGEGGINVVDEKILEGFCSFLKSFGILLAADEVQTGLYRTGRMFACEHSGLEPDILVLGKSLGGGLPIGATVIETGLDFDEFGRHSNTFGGGAVVAASALTVLELMESLNRDLLLYNILALQEFAPEGLGLMRRWRFETTELRDAFVTEAKARGVLVLGAGKKNARFMPQVNIEPALLNEAMGILKSIDIPHIGS